VRGVGPSSNPQPGGETTLSSTTAYSIKFIPIRTGSAIRKSQGSHGLESTETYLYKLSFATDESNWLDETYTRIYMLYIYIYKHIIVHTIVGT